MTQESDALERGLPLQPHAATRSARLLATAGLMIATAMQAADVSIANVALPRIAQDLGGGIELGAWVMTSYLCAAAVAAPFTAWLRRRHGARTLFPGVVLAFMAASALCALAPSSAALIGFRIAQGAAAGLILPLAQAVLLDISPPERHARMLGIWGAALMLGPVLGPVVGGLLTDLWSWRGVFAVNLPLGLLVVMLLRRLQYREATADDQPIDAVGALMLMIGIGALQLSLERGVGASWLASPELLAELAITIGAFTAMILRARNSGFTVFRPDILKDINFAAAAAYNFLTSAMLFVAVVFIPALSEGPLGYTATVAGLTIVPRAVVMMAVMLCIGPLIDKVNYRILLSAGWLLMAAGLFMLSVLPRGNELWWLVAGSTIQSVGAGMLFTPYSALAYSTLPIELRTDAAGLYSLLRQLGFASGVALMSSVLRQITAANVTRLSAAGGVAAAQAANIAAFDAYCRCFRMMAVACLILLPGVFLFRVARLGGKAKAPA